MQTNTLLLNRILGTCDLRHYVDWSVARLCEGVDSPSLRILAGLNPVTESEEIGSYFIKACRELGINDVLPLGDPRNAAPLIFKAYEGEDIPAKTAIRMLAYLYERSDYCDPLLSVFYGIEEELSLRGSGYEGGFYPPNCLTSLDEALALEISLFTQAQKLNLPPKFLHFIRCESCGWIGEPKLRSKTLAEKILGLIPWGHSKPVRWPTCAQCGRCDYKIMMDPSVRQDFFDGIKSENKESH
jgi:hypothetical protein